MNLIKFHHLVFLEQAVQVKHQLVNREVLPIPQLANALLGERLFFWLVNIWLSKKMNFSKIVKICFLE